MPLDLTRLDVTAETVTVDDAAEFTITIGAQDTALDVSGATVPTEQQSPISVEDTSGTQVDPARATDFPSATTVGHDLSDSNLTVGPVPVGRSQALIVSGNPTGGGDFSVTIEWTDGNGNVFRVQNASDTEVDLSGQTSSASSRLFRKGPQAKVTFSGTDTAFNAFVDSHA